MIGVAPLSPRGHWLLALLRHLAVTSLGAWAVWVQVEYRLPGPLVFALPWVGLALTTLSVVMLANHALRWAPRVDPVRGLFERIEYWGSLGVLLFAVWGLLLFTNGWRDGSIPTPHHSQILDIGAGELEGDLGIPTVSWATMRSWRAKGRLERVRLWTEERRRLWPGEAVVVQIRRGALNIPWIHAIERDFEKYARDVLDVTPTASAAWLDLASIYIRERRWKEAADAASRYRDLSPTAQGSLAFIASAFLRAGRPREVIALLDPIAEGHDDYWILKTLAVAWAKLGPSARPVALLQRAIKLDPEDAQPYYILGQVYQEWGWNGDALPLYEKVLELEPLFPDVRQRVEALRAARATNPGGVEWIVGRSLR